MNFSKHITLRKSLSLILVFALACTLFAGCKKDDTTDDSQPQLNINLNEPSESSSEPTGAPENMATVTKPLNVRDDATLEATIIGTLEEGARIEITEQKHSVGYDWGFTPSIGQGGWIVMQYVEMDIKPNASTPNAGTTPGTSTGSSSTEPTTGDATNLNLKGIITVDGLNIREEPNTDGKLAGKYDRGYVVTILETKGEWGRTNKGWIKMEYVNTSGTGNTGTGSSTNTNTGSGTGSNTNTNSNTNTSTNTNTNTSTNTTVSGNGSTKVIARGIVNTGELNLRAKASKDSTRLGSLKYGARVEILEKSGNWGRTSKGWVSLSYVYQDGTTGSKTATGTVTATTLNIRLGPGTNYEPVGSYTKGDEINILEQFTYGDVTWGCTKKGWVSLDHVDLDGTDDDDDDDATDVRRTGVVNVDNLNIREDASTDYDSVGSYDEGDKVTILQIKNGWGRTNKGWIYLKYVDFDDDDDDDVDYDDDDTRRTGVITASELNIREEPGTGYDSVGTYEKGDVVTILQIKNGWGRTNKGWIYMEHVDLDGDASSSSSSSWE